MSPYAIVGFAALAFVVVSWLVISFSAPSPRRVVLEWLSATALYVALSALFANLCRRSWESDNTFALVAFGLLLVIFAAGGVVSLANALLSTRGPTREQQGATN